MIASEGAGGYNAGEWFNVSGTADEVAGVYTFTLDWSDPDSPTVTVTPGETADADNPDASTDGAKYLYYGDGVCKKFYDQGDGTYRLTVDFASSWGFLIRTSNTSWDNGTKYGAPSSSDKVTLGEPFALDNTTAAVEVPFGFLHRLVRRPQLRSCRPMRLVARLPGHRLRRPRMGGTRRGWIPPGCREAHLPQRHVGREPALPRHVL